MLFPKNILFMVVGILFSVSCLNAQSDNHFFSPLSSEFYSREASEIQSRPIPVLYNNKNEQKTYSQIIKNRNQTIAEELIQNKIVHDSVLLGVCERVLSKLMSSNSSYKYGNIHLFLSRSPVANACCFGEGTLFVNLGLLLWIDNEDELALVLAHELSHQLLDHSENKIKKNIAFIASEDFISEMKKIKKSSDGKYEKYKSLMKEIAVQAGTHSRYKESEADSLGLVLIKNSGYNIQKASLILLKLDNVDDLFLSGKLYSVKEAFLRTGVDSNFFVTKKKYYGLSSAQVQMNADKDFDSIKTHPDCLARFKRINSGIKEIPKINCCTFLSNYKKELKERTLVELIRYEFESNELTMASHLCLFAIHNGFSSPFYNQILSASFSRIGIADKELSKFSVTDAKANANTTLKELQDLIFKFDNSDISNISKYFLNKSILENSDDYQFAKLQFNIFQKTEDKKVLENTFVSR